MRANFASACGLGVRGLRAFFALTLQEAPTICRNVCGQDLQAVSPMEILPQLHWCNLICLQLMSVLCATLLDHLPSCHTLRMQGLPVNAIVLYTTTSALVWWLGVLAISFLNEAKVFTQQQLCLPCSLLVSDICTISSMTSIRK